MCGYPNTSGQLHKALLFIEDPYDIYLAVFGYPDIS